MTDAAEMPPRPEEVLDPDRIQYQAMTNLSDDDYRRLAADIRENGVLQPVIVDDSEDQVIIDGHHREAIAKHYDLPDAKQPSYVVVSGMDDGRKLARAIKQNLIGRDTTDGVKRHAVKQYIESAWDRTEHGDLVRPPSKSDEHDEPHMTDTEVGEKLGVSQQLVSKVINCTNDSIIYHDRVKARKYYENNPDVSYREVARQVDASQPTVTEWLKEDFDEGDDNGDGQDTLAVTARDKDEAEAAAEVTRQATDGGVAAETAKDVRKDLAAGDASPTDAYEDVRQAEREYKERQQRQSREEQRRKSYQSVDKTVEIRQGDFREVLVDVEAESVDHIITDPPYDEDALELWEAIGEHAARVLKPGGFLIAYSGKAHLPRIHARLSDHLTYHWQAVVNHSGPGAKIFSRKLRTGYKPILIYTKGDADVQDDFVTDVIEGAGREKDQHDWQQAEAEAAALVERFTEVDDRVCDPMAGSGTVGVACDRLDRRCLLIDRDADAVKTARERVA